MNVIDKAINSCDETWKQHKNNSNPEDKYKWKYSVRVRFGNRTEFVYGPREWPSQSKNISYVKNELKDWVKRNGKINYEPYDIQFLGEYK